MSLTHFDKHGKARMVDVTDKPATQRIATAEGRVRMAAETLEVIREGRAEKGDVLGAARLAGIMAAKRTSELIPLCHPLPLASVEVAFQTGDDPPEVVFEATVKCAGPTGVEMEAMTACAIIGLTIYDMTKAVDRGMEIGPIRLLSKSGGRSGTWSRDAGLHQLKR